MWAMKSAAGVIAVSPWTRVGGSIAQPTPGSHARIGKNDPRRTLSRTLAMRSGLAPARVRFHGTTMFTGWLAATDWLTTSVVASGCDVGVARPSTVTGPAVSLLPAAATTGALPHSRNTIRSVGRSGVKRTLTVPVTVLS